MINDFSYMAFWVFLWNIAKRARIIGLPVIDKQIRHMGHTIFGWPTLKIMCDTHHPLSSIQDGCHCF
jgi:hypothetical protein